MTLESFLNHPLLIWEWLSWVVSFGLLQSALRFVWNRGKKKGMKEYDEYKKWEKVFKEKKE